MNDPSAAHSQAALDLGLRVRRLQKLLAPYLMSQMAGDMHGHELSFRQMGSLFQLRAAGQLSVTALAQRAHLSLPAASHLVNRLVRRGLLARREDPENRRQKIVMLTPKGSRLLEQFERISAQAYGTLLAGVPDAVLARAQDALDELLGHLAGAGHPSCLFSERDPQ
ncbi:MarR family winged helix-turn-helix transcriptional regulator [Deinococcus peraridilitoris]|uniref:Transcriptional regulator n=1 Tax=Deinococcus peraridilitoris (strain DSM 19664 / LMG 22246 / CIP 109416 / KR-200) TaxID=937777 RepID=K9ZWZ4_DEIPD|nr:MarR family transcriptional regulator [Deinococcus peraridilitoris]AFZ65704.1 transcriptional regulator [Deinococcus peraridilitoris DSM 19664]